MHVSSKFYRGNVLTYSENLQNAFEKLSTIRRAHNYFSNASGKNVATSGVKAAHANELYL